jgi:hypothetical protein
MLTRDGHRYFAIRLARIASLRALGWDPDAYGERYRRQMVELARWVVNPGDERFAYELRLVSHPEPDRYTAGRIDVALLCRLTGLTASQATIHADTVLTKLSADMGEYEFERVPRAAVAALLAPFPVEHLVKVRRRLSRERLDTLRPGDRTRRNGAFGFARPRQEAPSAGRAPDRDRSTVVHTFDFRPDYGPANPLFDLLLRTPHPVAVGIRLQPTRLTAAEAGFLERQIHTCERAVQFTLAGAADPDSLSPMLSEQARLFRTCQEVNLNGLRDDAAVVTISVAASVAIPDPIVDTVGSFVTGPAGGLNPDSGPFQHLAGGFDVDPGAAEDREAFTTLDLLASPLPLYAEAGRLPHLFDAVGASAAFRLPPSGGDALPGLASRDWRLLLPPAGWPGEGAVLGETKAPGINQRVCVADSDRLLHTYVVGRTGTGKTTLLETMALDDLRRGKGLCVIDPHGDLFNRLLGKVPKDRIDDIILIDPNDADYPVGLNPLEWRTRDERDRLIGEAQAAIARLMTDEYGSYGNWYMGPVFMDHLDLGLRLVTSDPQEPGTFLDFYNLYAESHYARRWEHTHLQDPLLERRLAELLQMDPTRPASNDGMPFGIYIRSKVADFVAGAAIRNLIAQRRSTIDFRRAMDEGKVILVNLGVGESSRNPLSPRHGRVLGMLLLGRLYAAAKDRPVNRRTPFHVYVDEFHSLATETFVDMLSELRKFQVSLVLANQFVSQIKDERIRAAVFGNVGTMVVFPVGLADAPLLEPEMAPLTRSDLTNLPVWNAYVRAPGRAPTPFTIASILDPEPYRVARAREVRAASRRKYARPRRKVEAEILEAATPREDTPIGELGLPAAATAILQAAGIPTLEVLVKKRASQLTEIPGFGRRSLAGVNDALASRGLTLRPPQSRREPMTPDEWLESLDN